jgi:predicted DsbA family dithiol-disulfide isomerase
VLPGDGAESVGTLPVVPDSPTAPIAPAPTSIDAFIDPMCPFAYQTSLWLRDVRDRVGVDLRWRFFSLEEINREPGQPHPWERDWAYGFSQMRVGALLRRQGQQAVDEWYAAVGHAFFVDARPTHDPDVHRAVLAEIGVDPAVLDEALADSTTAEEVRADHDEVVETHGGHGVPTLVFDTGQVLFGPVVAPAPTGDAALRLWDLVCAWGEVPYLYELRQPKTADDLTHLGEQFAPYFTARAWKSVAKPAP